MKAITLIFSLLLAAPALGQSPGKCFNFRETAAFATDATGETFVGAGFNFNASRGAGWTSSQGNLRDRMNTLDRRLAGLHFSTNNTFRTTLTPGQWNLSLAVGDPQFPQVQRVEIKSGSTVLATIAGATPQGSFLDATGIVRPASLWASSNQSIVLTVGSNPIDIKIGDGSSNTTLAHACFTPASGGPVNQPPTVACPANAQMQTPGVLNLSATASDDGLRAPLAFEWTSLTLTPSLLSAPTSTSTMLTDPPTGTHVLNFTARDGEHAASCDTTISVTAPPPPLPPILAPVDLCIGLVLTNTIKFEVYVEPNPIPVRTQEALPGHVLPQANPVNACLLQDQPIADGVYTFRVKRWFLNDPVPVESIRQVEKR